MDFNKLKLAKPKFSFKNLLSLDKDKANNYTLALLVLFIAFGAVLYLSGGNNSNVTPLAGLVSEISIGEQAEETEEAEEIEAVSEESGALIIEETKDPEVKEYLTDPTRKTYSEKAQAGDGLTHISRRVVDSYLKDQGETLSAERKIYVEDYISKHLGGGELLLNEDVSISSDLIVEAVSASYQLSSAQLDNLTQYSALVSSFN